MTAPKTRNAALMKERILHAAHAAFARSGYAGVGLREVAADAGATSALLVRYFGTKVALFAATLVWTVEHHGVFSHDKPQFGTTMAGLIRDRGSIDITAMLVLAMSDPERQEMATRVARERMVAPLVEWLGPPDATVRAMNLFGLLTGFAVQARGIGDPEILERCLDWLAKTLQAIVDEQ